jgi:DNA processing protein
VAGDKARGLLDGLDPDTWPIPDGTWTICRHSAAYPSSLRDLAAEAPALISGCGAFAALDGLDPATTATIVGARRASAYGIEVATRLGFELASAGLTVVSGMANGIDAAGHRGALEGGGGTIAVLGGGADRPSPSGQRRLHARILDSGCAISELPPGTPPARWTFPARNRIMAALASMTIVVEAAERSGSLITATMAIELGRDVGAVPGQVTSWLSAGTNALLADGAFVIRDAGDVLDRMLGPGSRSPPAGPPLAAGLAAVLDSVESGTASPDAVALDCTLAPPEVAAALARLEILGYVRGDAAGRYSRSALARPA